jgi:polyketide synthase PksN
MDSAIIGMAFRFPGACDGKVFWRNLSQRRSSITEIPQQRWDWRAFWGDPKLEVNKSFSKWGGFIDDVDAFDHEFFGLLPKVVHNMDPQQRIMLELAWSCLEDAGVAPSTLRGRNVGVFTGVTHHDYKELLASAKVQIEPYHYAGTATVVVPNRVSHVFGLRGPSIPIDTACSSTLNAIHAAIRSFEAGECEMALAGGISLILNPARHVSVSKMGTLSPTGSCKTLDDRADGYVRGEGAGFFLIKPLERALADGDRIHGVIKGSAINHCGETHTLTYPSADAQADVIVAAHERAGVPVSSVNFVELHGTGTAKGDPIEFEGLHQAYTRLAERQGIALQTPFCGLSSAKTNIGHLEAAAGMAGVAKVLLAFRHRQLPGFHDFRVLNPRVNIDGTPFYILDETRPWLPVDPQTPLRAGVSSFGFGGTNAHIILEEPPAPVAAAKSRRRSGKPTPSLIALSAKTTGALARRCEELAAWLQEDAGAHTLHEISRALLLDRDHLDHRFACVVDDLDALGEALRASSTARSCAAPPPEARETADAEGESLFARLKTRGKDARDAYMRLAELFMAGCDLPWARLFDNKPARRVPLPTYPFARHRFWLPESRVDIYPGQRDWTGTVLHPLLHGNVSVIDPHRFVSRFDGSEHFLADHRVEGRRLLSAAACLEMVRAALQRLHSRTDGPQCVHFSEVLWLRPLVVEQEAVSVEVVLDEIAGNGDLEFVILQRQGKDSLTLCRGRVGSRFPPDGTASGPSRSLIEQEATSRTADAIYAGFAEQGIDFGPSHRLLREFAVSGDRASARIEVPKNLREQAAAYDLHPGIVDAAFQAAVVSLAGTDEPIRAAIPVALDSATIHHSPSGIVHAATQHNVGTGRFDIDLFDGLDGSRLCASFRGLDFRGLHSPVPELSVPAAHSEGHRIDTPPTLVDTLYLPEWRIEPARPTAAGIAEIVLVGARRSIESIELALRSSKRFVGTRFELFPLGESDDRNAPGAPDAGAIYGEFATYRDAFEALVARGVAFDRVLLVPPVELSMDHGMRLVATAHSVFALVKSMLREIKAARFVQLAPVGDDFVEYRALSGLFKTMRAEKPGYNGRVVSGALSPASSDRVANIVADEFLDPREATDVRYVDDVRQVRGFAAVPSQVDGLDGGFGFREGGTYLITGGLGAIGRIVASHLCGRYRARVYLASRSGLTPEQQSAMDALSAGGGSAHHLICDPCNAVDVRRAIAAIHADGRRLNGVLHAAGMIQDGFILRKSPEEFARVIAPKTIGTINLDLETRGEPLDMFVLFSSVAGVVGNVGQCDYAYGNAFEDVYAESRETLRLRGQRDGRSLSIDWPLWRNGGMRLGDAEIAALNRAFGLVPMEDSIGIDALEFGLSQPSPQLVVMPGDTARIRGILDATVVDAISPVARGSARVSREAVTAYLSAALARELRIPAEFESDRSFKDYGFDSIVMVEVVGMLEATFGRLSKTLFFEYPTMQALSGYFLAHHAAVFESMMPDTSDAGRSHAGSIAADGASTAGLSVDRDAIEGYLCEAFAKELGIPPEFDPDRSFKEYGFDSVVMIEVLTMLEATFGRLSKTLFFEYPTMRALVGYFAEHHGAAFERMLPGANVHNAEVLATGAPAPMAIAPAVRTAALAARSSAVSGADEDAIAIIGIAGRYPQADTLEQFWDNLRIGRDCIEEIPQRRNDLAAKLRVQRGEPTRGHTYADWGGFLSDVDRFDAMFFNISPREAESLDPNERLFLEVAAHAIEDAGYTPEELAPPRGLRDSPVGVYVGVMWGDYQLHGVDGPRDAWHSPHSSYWAIPNRVSYQFNFSGPSLAIDSACSSSLTAIHLACQALRAGEIDIAIAGASNLSLHPSKYNLLSDLMILSTDGRCRAFGEGGSGYVPGEGVGAVVLKPLSAARRDGDQIYGIIRGTAVNHGGKASGFTVPNPNRQAALIREALEASGIDPRHISYVEAHGTGTSLGDPIEIAGLAAAFEQEDRQYCAIGSVKSNIGHLEAAAGIAGLTKVLLQMRHRTLVPSIHSESLNPYIDFERTPFRVQRTLQPWVRPTVQRHGARIELPRLAGVSSFGAGGANAHILVEEYPDDARADAVLDGSALFVLSARRESALRDSAAALAERLETQPAIGMLDASYTLQVGRAAMEYRFAFVVDRRDALIETLRRFANGDMPLRDAWSGHRDGAKRDPVIASRLKAAVGRIDEWLRTRDLPALAQSWADGASIDWRRLHQPGNRRRVSLPGYPFQRQRYWGPETPVAELRVPLHRLIDENVSTLEEQAFAKLFRPDEFYLRDHRLGDNRILPGVAYLEMALQASRLAAPRHRALALRDVHWLRPIVVNDMPQSVRITLAPNRGAVDFEIRGETDGSGRRFAHGTIEIEDVSGVSSAADIAEPVDIHSVIRRCRMVDRGGVDTAFAAMGFVFGDSFRLIEALHHNEDEAIGMLRIPAVRGGTIEHFVLHPALLDAAIRCSLGIGGLSSHGAQIAVPVKLRRIEISGDLRSAGEFAFAYARRSPIAAMEPSQRSSDVLLCDAEGRVLVRIDGLISAPAPQLARIVSRVENAPRAAAATMRSIKAGMARESIAGAAMDRTAPLMDTAIALLAGMLSEVTRVPVDQIDPAAPLENYGIDSMMIASLNRMLETRLGELPKTLFFEYQELSALAGYLVSEHAQALHAMQPVASAQNPVEPPAHALDMPVAASGRTVTDTERKAVIAFLIRTLADTTGATEADIDPYAPLENYGIDSIMIVKLTSAIEEAFGAVSKTLFFEFQDIAGLSGYLAETFPAAARRLEGGQCLTARHEAASPVDADVLQHLFATLRRVLGSAADVCSIDTPIADWSLDPVSIVQATHALSLDFDGLDPFDPFRHATLREWAGALRWKPGREPAETAMAGPLSVAAARSTGFRRFGVDDARAEFEEIAIVGISGRYPDAEDLNAFWRNLVQGRDSITEIPLSRWDHDSIYHPDRSHKGTAYSKWGGFIEGIDLFDAQFFNVSAREAELMDPQERLFLQIAWECVEDACYTRNSLKGTSAGVFVGVAWPYYSQFDVSEEQLKSGRPSTPFASIANRVSYFMNFSGPSMAIDTMCSSSLSAIHLACRAIDAGDCDVAIAGGVNLMPHRNKYLQLSMAQFLSSDGRCRAFGEGGDGYVPGEGVGAVLLKRLGKALDDGDHIYGVIKASSVNHGGKTNGFTVPNPVAQTALVSNALQRSGWDPRTIDYIEAHGTGTSLGDPIEIAGLSRALGHALAAVAGPDATLPMQGCRIGSVKSNIGHLESAAAIAGLTKILLQFRHDTIVASLHSSTLNPNIDFSRTPFRVVQSSEPWRARDPHMPRRAALSSFGAGGSNAHCLIEDHPRQLPAAASNRPALFVLSADSEQRLALYIERIIAFLERGGDADSGIDLAALAYASQVGREAMAERIAVVATTPGELLDALRGYRNGASSGLLVRGTSRKPGESLEAVFDEAEKDALIRNLVGSGRLQQLARAWASMLDVDWTRHAAALFAATAGPGHPPRRMPFPTMPFMSERYWIEERANPQSIAVLHPLIDRNASTLSAIVYRKRFDGREFYLRDHIVRTDRDRMILPGVAYLEMARAAGDLSVAGHGLQVDRIRNLMWIQPFEIEGDPDDLSVRIQSDDSSLRFEIARDFDRAICAEGELGLRSVDASCEDEYLDLDAILARGRLMEPGCAQIYDGFRRMGFLFGPSFQVTQARYRVDEGALCRLLLPAHLHSGYADYGLHPSMLDAALRAGLAVEVDGVGTTVPIVPFALDELEFRHPLTEECYAYVVRGRDAVVQSVPGRHTPGAEAAAYKWDIVITDPAGMILAKLHGLSGRPLNRPGATTLRVLQYFGDQLLPAPIQNASASTGAGWSVLAMMRDPSLLDALQRAMPDARRIMPVLLMDDGDAQHAHSGLDAVDPTSEEQVLALFESLHARDLLPDRIVYAEAASEPLVDAGGDADAAGRSANRNIHAVRHVFLASQRFNKDARIRLLYAYRDADIAQPWHEAVAGYARALLTVDHRFELSTFCDDRSEPQAWAESIVAELAADGAFGAQEIVWRGGRRHRRGLRAMDGDFHVVPESIGPLPVREDGVYLITGGAGKLGLSVARYLAGQRHVRLMLCGRSVEISEGLRGSMDALRALGASVEYRSVDIADSDAVEALVASTVAEFGGLHGVVHCAGIASEVSILDLDARAFSGILSPKIDGLIALDRATAGQLLDFFVNFSSVSAVIGDFGACAYAVGNRFMDGHARWRERMRAQGLRNGRSLSIGWPLWSSGGMEISGSDASVFEFSGMQSITESEGIEIFDRLLRGTHPHVVVTIGDPVRVARVLRLDDVRAADVASAPTSRVEPATGRAVATARVPSITKVAVSSPTVGADAVDSLSLRTERYLKTHIAAITKTSLDVIDSRRSFEECGMDSVLMLELHAALSQDFEGLPKTALFEYDSAEKLALYLIEFHGDALRLRLGVVATSTAASPRPGPREPAARIERQANAASWTFGLSAGLPLSVVKQPSKPEARADMAIPEAIAVVGIAGEFPSSPDLDTFWRHLRDGRDCLSPIPTDRGFAASLNRHRSRSGSLIADKGGFIADVDLFDPELFRMTQTEADKADPQLRVLLRTAWRAVEDAAYTPQTLAASRVGVFVGAMNEDFTRISSELQAESTEFLGPGSVSSELSNRLSFLMNFCGPSVTVSTACSASLTALHLACRSIHAGDCEAALVGGVNLSLHHSKYQLLHEMKLLSPDGDERTFDESANGMVPSEGASVVLLKPLSRAIADGDHVYGMIRASRIGHSGVGAGQFMPNLRVMEDTAAECIRDAAVGADEVTYLETHGTGTELGDPIELKALANAVRRTSKAIGHCAIGSKANLGHMEAVSGLCSLIKVLLCMRHGEIAPCAKLTRINTSFDHARSPFYFPMRAMVWPRNARGTRVAGINSFGMGGSNAFVVVESSQAEIIDSAEAPAPALLLMSARSAEGLRRYATSLTAFLRTRVAEGMGPEAFADLAYSSQVGRIACRYRLAIIASDARSALDALDGYSFEASRPAAAIFSGDIEAPSATEMLRLISGNAGSDFVQTLLRTAKLDSLAELWVRGAAIPWQQLHDGRPRRRVPFPGMPFEQTRCDLRNLLGRTSDGRAEKEADTTTARVLAESETISSLDAVSLSGSWRRLSDIAIDAADFEGIADDEMLRRYWLEQLGDAADTAIEFGETLRLEAGLDPSGLPRSERQAEVHCVSEVIDNELVRVLQGFGQRHGIALETVVSAAWAILVNRYTKARCSQFGLRDATTAVDGNPLPIRVRTVGRQKILEWLLELQATLTNRCRHAVVPIGRIGEWVGRDVLFDAVLTFDATVEAKPVAVGERRVSAVEGLADCRPCMELVISADSDRLELSLLYIAATPDYERAGMLLEQLKVLLEGIASNPDKMPSALGMRTKVESREGFWKVMEATTE